MAANSNPKKSNRMVPRLISSLILVILVIVGLVIISHYMPESTLPKQFESTDEDVLLAASQPAPVKNQIGVAFWNVENLFDAVDQPKKNDPHPPDWSAGDYRQKIEHLTTVIKSMNQGNGPDILGLAEVENLKCLKDWFIGFAPYLNYQTIILIEGSDPRGIDVGIVGRYPVKEYHSHKTTRGTRDVLEVCFDIHGYPLWIYVAHLKSRWGGQEETEQKRINQARFIQELVNQRLQADPEADIIVMGDMNDNIEDRSIQEVLMNVSMPMFHGLTLLPEEKRGTYYWHNGKVWNEFDQLIFSCGLYESACNKNPNGLSIIESSMKVFRKFASDQGYPDEMYSDHFPVSIQLTVHHP